MRTRDAAGTRQQLLAAARLRFARDGYGATTVRDIAADAGVNVALINRYFDSKEGLFEACLEHVARDLGRQRTEPPTLEYVVQAMLSQAVASPNGDLSIHLMLLLRSSGDERADALRMATLRSFAVGTATAAGLDPTSESDILRAQLAIATALGLVLLRSTGLEPLGSATEADLDAPLGDFFRELLAPR